MKIHCFVCFVLVYQFTVSALPASRNFTVVKLIPPSPHQNDAGGGLVPQESDEGVMADQRSAFLGKKADSFRFHRPGFEHVPGSVSLESANHPGLYLRYKNYKFHLEKMNPSGLFEKDATFIERKTQTRGAAAYELFNHPGWFMCHDKKSKFGLVAKKLEIKSQEFLLGCLYMAVAQKPTKQDLKERLKLSHVKSEIGEAKGSIRNISGIISNDVSVDNIAKVTPGNGSESSHDKPEHLAGSQSNKTNEQQVLSKGNVTAINDVTPSKLSPNVTAGTKNSSTTAMDQVAKSKPVDNSTKESGLKMVDKLRDANVTGDVHVTNVTVDLQDKLPANEGKQLLQNDTQKVEDFTTNNLKNSSKLQVNTNKGKQVAIQEQPNAYVESADEGSAAAKQNAHAFEQGLTAKATNVSPLHKGGAITGTLQKNHQGVLSHKPTANANLDTLPKQFDVHLDFPNGKLNKTFNTPNQLAKITAQATAAALGLIHNAMHNKQLKQQASGYTKVGAVHPFQQQRQQKNFQPMNYANQQMRPQAMFRSPPNYMNARAPMAPRRPLVNSFTMKRPNSQFAYQPFRPMAPPQMFNNRYNYQYPGKGWTGLASIGKQSLMGHSAKLHQSVQNKLNVPGNKLEDESTKISEENDKCISLKFINKARKPIRLVSSMKLAGYLVTAETFKLKTVFKHPRKHHHVIFYARDADDRDNEILLNNNNAIAVTPGGCDLPFRSVVMSHHGQITNKDMEHLREDEEHKASMEAQRAVHGKGDDSFTQWTTFGPCSATCGRSLQTRTRSCKPGKMCKGETTESRTCIQTPCPVQTCHKTYSGKCCALPFVYRGAVSNRCLVDPHTQRSWCATTPNFDKEKRWGYCQPEGPHIEQVVPVIRSFLPVSPGQPQCAAACSRICMSWCPQQCCVPVAQR